MFLISIKPRKCVNMLFKNVLGNRNLFLIAILPKKYVKDLFEKIPLHGIVFLNNIKYEGCVEDTCDISNMFNTSISSKNFIKNC